MSKQEIDFFITLGMLVGKEFSTFEELKDSSIYQEIIAKNVKKED